MDAASFDMLIDFIVAACGLYLAYSAIRIKKTRNIRNSILIGKGIDIRRDSDVEGYIDYICPKATVFGILFFLDGAFQLAGRYFEFPIRLSVAIYALFFVIMIVFFIIISRAQKRFLEDPCKKKKKDREGA